MTFDWEVAITGLLLICLAGAAWVLVGWLYDNVMFRRVDRHATERWLRRQRKKEDDQ